MFALVFQFEVTSCVKKKRSANVEEKKRKRYSASTEPANIEISEDPSAP